MSYCTAGLTVYYHDKPFYLKLRLHVGEAAEQKNIYVLLPPQRKRGFLQNFPKMSKTTKLPYVGTAGHSELCFHLRWAGKFGIVTIRAFLHCQTQDPLESLSWTSSYVQSALILRLRFMRMFENVPDAHLLQTQTDCGSKQEREASVIIWLPNCLELV